MKDNLLVDTAVGLHRRMPVGIVADYPAMEGTSAVVVAVAVAVVEGEVENRNRSQGRLESMK